MEHRVTVQWELWNSECLRDSDLTAELASLSPQTDAPEIEDRFYRDLEFGTGGLRGVIGAGTNRMNVYTVAKATQGYSNYINKNFTGPSVAIAYDSRLKSDLFAKTAAEVFAANGIRVFIYPELMPTPALSFAVRELACSGGIVITASHNPAKYNGYKVYGPDGCQITTEAAKAIQKEIDSVDMFRDVKYMPFEDGASSGIISYIGPDTVDSYIKAVSSQSLCGKEEMDRNVSIVYTPLNGAGLKCVTRCLKENGFTNISVVAEQEKPDGNFPTCPYPNPEVREALELGLRDAKKLGSDLLLATDPDCDRVGIAVRDGEDYVLLSGNEVGLLLLDFICRSRTALGNMPEKPIFVKTIVTMDLAKQIAADYGVETVDVLTGFKFIGEQIGLLEKKGEESRFILGFEESYGYLTGGYVRDKDAVDGALMISEMFAYYKSLGTSLLEVLNGLYEKYGYCLNTLHSYAFEGAEGFSKMQEIMKRFRADYGFQGKTSLTGWLGRKILSVSDFKESVKWKENGSQESIDLPVSDALKYELEGNLSVVVRPSGTEPKLKLYLSVCAENREAAAELERQLTKELEMVLER